MGFRDAVMACLTKYFQFRGRATRSEFWWFFLFSLILGYILMVPESLFPDLAHIFALLNLAISVLLFIPLITVSSRRLHDIGRSGWWQLLNFGWLFIVPIGGIIYGLATEEFGATPESELMTALVWLVVSVIGFASTAGLVTYWFAKRSDPDKNKYDIDTIQAANKLSG